MSSVIFVNTLLTNLLAELSFHIFPFYLTMCVFIPIWHCLLRTFIPWYWICHHIYSLPLCSRALKRTIYYYVIKQIQVAVFLLHISLYILWQDQCIEMLCFGHYYPSYSHFLISRKHGKGHRNVSHISHKYKTSCGAERKPDWIMNFYQPDEKQSTSDNRKLN